MHSGEDGSTSRILSGRHHVSGAYPKLRENTVTLHRQNQGMRSTGSGSCAGAWLSSALLFMLASCTTNTEVRVIFSADAALEASWERLRLTVTTPDGKETVQAFRSEDGAMPHELRLVPEGDDATREYDLVAELFDCREDDTCRIGKVRIFRAGFVAGESRVIRLHFDESCRQVDCGLGTTCTAGSCEPACFSPQPASSTERTLGEVCPVFVSAASGNNHPTTCVRPETPCSDISYALDNYASSSGGQTIHVRGSDDRGTQLQYGMLSLAATHSGVVDRPTRVRAWPGTGRPLLWSEAPHTLRVDGGISNLVIEGLEIAGGTSAAVGLYNCQGITFRRNLVRDAQELGIEVANAQALIIEDNVVLDTYSAPAEWKPKEGALYIRMASESIEITGNLICRSRGRGISVASPDTHGIEIVRNTVILVEHDGIGASQAPTGLVVRSNIIAHNGGVGLFGGTDAGLLDVSSNWFFQNAMGPSDLEHTNWEDGNTLGMDPGFADLNGCRPELRPGSLALDRSSEGARGANPAILDPL